MTCLQPTRHMNILSILIMTLFLKTHSDDLLRHLGISVSEDNNLYHQFIG